MPVMSLGIKSGVNWIRLKSRRQRLGERVHHQGFGEPGNALQDAVAAGENGDQKLIDDVVLAHDLAGHLFADGRIGLVELVELGEIDVVG